MERASTRVRQRRPFWQTWAVFLVLTAMAAMIGDLGLPGAWYTSLVKPAWNPPNWLFAPAWSALDLMIAAAGALAWRTGMTRGCAAAHDGAVGRPDGAQWLKDAVFCLAAT